MYYESSDFLETADSDTLKQIARTRELTREYYFSDYGDIEKRTSILRELLGGIGENVLIDTPFHCDYGKNIFLGNDVIINMNCTFVDNKTIRIGNSVLIASNVQIYTSSHPVLPQERLVPDWMERQTTFFRTTSDRDRKQRLDWRRLYSSSRSHYRRKQRDRGWKRSYPPCPS